MLLAAGADPASKFMGCGVSNIGWSSLIKASLSVRGMKYTSQHRCDKRMDDKMALYRECCFLNWKQS